MRYFWSGSANPGRPDGRGSEVNVGIGTSAPNTTLQGIGDTKVGTGGNGCPMNSGTAL